MRKPVAIRLAEIGDLPAIVALHADDVLGGHGDTADPAVRPHYEAAFRAIAENPATRLYVAERDGRVIGTFQLVLVRSIPDRGGLKATLEAVQVAASERGRGIGAAMVRFAVEEARVAGAVFVQLTSNLARTEAHRFYERLGFARSHAGFKRRLD